VKPLIDAFGIPATTASPACTTTSPPPSAATSPPTPGGQASNQVRLPAVRQQAGARPAVFQLTAGGALTIRFPTLPLTGGDA
jgi:hypothetical protein